MNIAILGDGLLGRSLFDHLAPRERAYGDPPALVMLSHADVDITSYDSIVRAFEPHKPDVVINTVAFHALAACEKDAERAFDLNARAAERVARIVPTVYISTDYVFNDGGPHDESMPGQQPRSVYGRSKLAGELATLEQGGIVVRVSGLYGHHRSHKGPTFPETILSGFDPIKLPTDQRFSPTYAPDAAERIAGLAIALADRQSVLAGTHSSMPMTKSGVERMLAVEGIYHAANRGSCSWAEFGEHIIDVARHRRHVLPFTAKDPLRPTNSALKSTRLTQLPHWADALNRWALRRDLIPQTSPTA